MTLKFHVEIMTVLTSGYLGNHSKKVNTFRRVVRSKNMGWITGGVEVGRWSRAGSRGTGQGIKLPEAESKLAPFLVCGGKYSHFHQSQQHRPEKVDVHLSPLRADACEYIT